MQKLQWSKICLKKIIPPFNCACLNTTHLGRIWERDRTTFTSKRCLIGRRGWRSGFCEHAPIGRAVFLWSFESFRSCRWACKVHLGRPTTTPELRKVAHIPPSGTHGKFALTTSLNTDNVIFCRRSGPYQHEAHGPPGPGPWTVEKTLLIFMEIFSFQALGYSLLPGQDQVWITTNQFTRFHTDQFDEMLCKLNSSEYARSLKQNPPCL